MEDLLSDSVPFESSLLQDPSLKGWYVRYEVTGFGAQVSGPYLTLEIAEEQCQDIAGFEGVVGAHVSSVP